MKKLAPHIQTTLATWALIAAPIALIVGIVALVVSVAGIATRPPIPNTITKVDNTDAAKQFGRDYMTLWLAGTTTRDNQRHLDRLKNMTSAPGTLELPSTAYRVERLDIRVTGQEEVTTAYPQYTTWRLRCDALVVTPGARQPVTRVFEFDAASYGDQSFQVIALPRQVNDVETPFRTEPAHHLQADPRSPLFAAAQNFASAYLAPQSKDATLGSTVGPDFKGQPVAGSMWQAVQVTDVFYLPGDKKFDADALKEGDTVHALITARASTSASTFSIVQIPAEMIVLSNLVWAVNRIEEFVYVNAIQPIA